MKSTTLYATVIIGLVIAAVHADSITHGSTTINMDFVDIGHTGNPVDADRNLGAVDHNYRIGTYEVTIGQLAAARAADNRVGDGDENYWNDGTRTVGVNAPASNVTRYEAMKFANFLTSGNAVSGAYQFSNDGLTLLSVNRDVAVSIYGTVYVLPTPDEWHKAAYYRPENNGFYSDYANGNNFEPLKGTENGWNYGWVTGDPNYTWEVGFGGVEQNGTYDMMGNVGELSETGLQRGGMYNTSSAVLKNTYGGSTPAVTTEYSNVGFRVAAIPEPSTIAFVGLFGGGLLFIRRYFPSV